MFRESPEGKGPISHVPYGTLMRHKCWEHKKSVLPPSRTKETSDSNFPGCRRDPSLRRPCRFTSQGQEQGSGAFNKKQQTKRGLCSQQRGCWTQDAQRKWQEGCPQQRVHILVSWEGNTGVGHGLNMPIWAELIGGCRRPVSGSNCGRRGARRNCWRGAL